MAATATGRVEVYRERTEPHRDQPVQPFFSVLIATYNRAPLLLRAVQSVLGQTFRDFELIVLDDGSTDNTAEVVKQIGDVRIHYVPLGTTSGQSRALNSGIERARGQIVSFLDSDDEWLPTYLEEVSRAYACCADTALVYARYEKGPKWTISGGNVYPEVLRQGQLSATSTLNVRAAALRAVGGFREHHSVCNDDDLCFRVAERFAICHLPKELVVMHATCDAVTANSVRDAHGWAKLITEYRLEMLRHCGHNTLAYHCFRVSELMFGCFQLRQGGRYLVEATVNLAYRRGPLPTMDVCATMRWYARIGLAFVRGLRLRLSTGLR